MYFLLYGEDTYRSMKRLAQLRERFLGTRDPSGLNAVSFDAKRDGLDPLREAILTVPFLADKKFVVARGYLGASQDDQETLAEALPHLPDTTNLVFIEDEDAAGLAKSPLYPLLCQSEHTQEFKTVSPTEVGRFFVGELAALGVELTRDGEQAAVALLAPDSWQIIQEAEKLAAWCQARGLTKADVKAVQEVVTGSKEEPAFAFLDACVAGQPRQAAALMTALFEAGQSEHQILAAVSRQIRTLVAVRDLLDRGVRDQGAIAAALKMHPYPIGKAVRACAKLDAPLLERLFDAALDVEKDLKTSQTDRAAVELLAIQLAGAIGKR
jgi:DNA polymerase-3 subunit delta